MMARLKFGLSKVSEHSPLWLVNLTSILAIFIAAKHYLIGGLPGITEETKVLAAAWYDYVLNGAQVACAIAVIFGAKKPEKPVSDTLIK